MIFGCEKNIQLQTLIPKRAGGCMGEPNYEKEITPRIEVGNPKKDGARELVKTQ